VSSDAATGEHKRPLALVLEDDTLLADNFQVKLRRLLQQEAPCDWRAISLKSKCPYGTCISTHLSRVMPDGNEPADRCRHGVNWGFYAMLYRVDGLQDLRETLANVVWDDERPHCLDVDVALASISDQVEYYAVPNMQERGFLTEGAHGSSRMDKNREGLSIELQEEALSMTATTTRPSIKGLFKNIFFPKATTTTEAATTAPATTSTSLPTTTAHADFFPGSFRSRSDYMYQLSLQFRHSSPTTSAPLARTSGEARVGVENIKPGKEAVYDAWAEDFIDHGAGSPGRFAEAEAYAPPTARK